MKSLESDIQDQSGQSQPETTHSSSDQTCQHRPNILGPDPTAQTGQPQSGHSVANRSISDQTFKLRRPRAQTKHQNPDCTCQLRPDIPAQIGRLQTGFSSSGKVRPHCNTDPKASDWRSKLIPDSHSLRPDIQIWNGCASAAWTTLDQTSKISPGSLRLDTQAEIEQFQNRHLSSDWS